MIDRLDRHARELVAAVTRAGGRAVPVRLAACGIDTQHPSGLHIPQFSDSLPDAVLVRMVAGASFEAVTLRLGVLHALRELGVPVWNDARAIERCVDKSMTSFLLARAGLPTPPTWAIESPEMAREILARESGHGPLVLKPLFGSQGRGLRLLRSAEDLPPAGAVAGVYYLQRFVGAREGSFHDFRLLVCAGRVVAAMARHATTWITNVKQGGQPTPAVPDAVMRELAISAAAAVAASFAGVDILYGADGRPTLLEVNSMPAWSGLQKVTPVRVAGVIADELLGSLAKRTTG